MDSALARVIERCLGALETTDPRGSIEAILLESAKDPGIAEAIASRTKCADLKDLAIYRGPSLTLLAGALPPKFRAGPHNHNLWSVVSVCAGQEDNDFFEFDGARLKPVGSVSVVAPGVLANDADVIHAIHNPLSTPLLVLHAYGGDLFAVDRSTFDPETHEEIPFDWRRISSASATTE